MFLTLSSLLCVTKFFIMCDPLKKEAEMERGSHPFWANVVGKFVSSLC